jgi:predicted outer membrane protein
MQRWYRVRRNAVAALTISSLVAACGRDESSTQKQAAPGSTRQSTGEVVASLDTDNAAPSVKWIGDANIVALTSLLNNRVKAAADYELQQWGSDTTRAFAAEMSREHSAIRYSIDSLAGTLGVTPVLPALAIDIDTATRRQLARLEVAPGGRPLDRAYVNQQIESHELMLAYLSRFKAAAEHRELQTLMDTVRTRLKAHLTQARSLKLQFARVDSAKASADSARRARAQRTPQ